MGGEWERERERIGEPRRVGADVVFEELGGHHHRRHQQPLRTQRRTTAASQPPSAMRAHRRLLRLRRGETGLDVFGCEEERGLGCLEPLEVDEGDEGDA